MAKVPGVLLGVAMLCAAPLSAQDAPWVNQWYWGAQGGAVRFKTPDPSASWETGYTFGAHWFITGSRMGLYMSYDHILYDSALSVISDPTSGTGVRSVQFDNGRYIQADLIAMPLKGAMQLMIGAGFTIHNISDASVQGTFATPEDQAYSQALVKDAATRAFFNIMGGLQFLLGPRAAVYVSYEFISSTENFLLSAEQHTFGGGIRYSFGGRKEEVTTSR
ncbi:MAG: porin family protein [Gemmatimonadota bacterium]|nr:porin family protein [Gemmatimonadota bacterium]MDH4351084.1 porin family protein [Gemmatimonadota bacterium]MDH5198752.1 porin family protein [Gemmatimonadota bacterium]